MKNKSLIFAKLSGEYLKLESVLGPQGNRQRLHNHFQPDLVNEIFSSYSKLLDSLKELIPELYADLPEREVPEPSEGGSIPRSFLETIRRDIDYIFELNSQFTSLDSKDDKDLDIQRIFISHGSSPDWMQV